MSQAGMRPRRAGGKDRYPVPALPIPVERPARPGTSATRGAQPRCFGSGPAGPSVLRRPRGRAGPGSVNPPVHHLDDAVYLADQPVIVGDDQHGGAAIT